MRTVLDAMSFDEAGVRLPETEQSSTSRALIVFFVLVFVLGWLGDVPAALASRGLIGADNPYLGVLGVLAAVSPLVAAIIAARMVRGPNAARELLDSVFRGAKSGRWYVVAFVGELALAAGAIALALFLGGPDRLSSSFSWIGAPVLLLGIAVAFTVWEELGFRGFALRELERGRSALAAALLVGVAWGLWHLPLAFTPGTPTAEVPFPLFFAELVGSSILYTWLYNSTGQSVLFVTLFHAAGK